MKIKCPNCNTTYTLSTQKLKPGLKRVRCARCQSKFQISVPRPKSKPPEKQSDSGLQMALKPCPHCHQNVPTSAIRCRFCGKFKKNARLTIEKIRDEQARSEIIKEFALVCQSQPANLEALLTDLPVIFQLSYPEALKLKVNLQNKGVTLLLEEGEEIPFQAKDKEKEDTEQNRKNRPEHSETIYSKITVEQVLKDMDSRSSISQELLGNTLSRRKDLFMIILIAFIPFLSLNLESQYQLLFFPIFLGMLWAFIIFSFFGDGNVPVKKAVLYFIFSGTGGALIAVVGNAIIGEMLDFLPKLLFFVLVVGLVEETAKLLPILKFIKKPGVDRLSIRYLDILVLSLICGIGFSASENILYKTRIDEITGIAFILEQSDISRFSNMHFLRTISLPILHGSWTAIFGVISFHGFTIGKTRKYILWGLPIVAIIHGLYDAISSDSFANFIIIAFSFLSILILHSFCLYIDEMKYKELVENATKNNK